MNCDKCGAYTPHGATCCMECGFHRDMMRKCTNCGEPLSEGTEFCTGCGMPILKLEGSKICPRCAGPIIQTAKFCLICGMRLKDQFPKNIQASRCQHCGRTNDTAGKFCIYCGEKFQ